MYPALCQSDQTTIYSDICIVIIEKNMKNLKSFVIIKHSRNNFMKSSVVHLGYIQRYFILRRN